MKKTLALLLGVLMLLSLFIGCGGNTPAAPTNAPASSGSSATAAPTNAPASSGTPATSAPVEDDSPYRFAAGKYTLNADGYPTERYVYELPISTTDEVLTSWCTCYSPELIPAEGWASMDTWAGLRKMTGVNIEYNLVSWQSRADNFAVLLASDSLDDILMGASFYYKGSIIEAVEDEFFVNLMDYKEYLPCYLYECYQASKTNPDILRYIYNSDTVMATLYGRYDEVTPQMGLYARQDWLDALGLGKAENIKTYDQLTDVCQAFKTNYEGSWPLYLFDIIQLESYMFCGYNTYFTGSALNNKRIVDGKVEFCGSTDDDGRAMQQVYDWYAAGFIDPNYGSHSSTFDGGGYASTDVVGIFANVASTIASVEATMQNPNARWEPMPHPLMTEDQLVHYGQSATGFTYATTCISTKCENVPLALSWLDYWFSDEGSTYTSWGPEGLLWEYDDAGERRLTDFILHHEIDTAVAMCVFATSHLTEFCLLQSRRYYAFDGGERVTKAFDIWTIQNYDGAYNYPASIRLDSEASSEAAALMADLNTFYAENLVLFIDGSTPMSQWDNFQENLEQFNLSAVEAIWQDAYDAYLQAA